MEEEALHKARRLTDYYDVHEEIGRYLGCTLGAAGAGVLEPGCTLGLCPLGLSSMARQILMGSGAGAALSHAWTPWC